MHTLYEAYAQLILVYRPYAEVWFEDYDASGLVWC